MPDLKRIEYMVSIPDARSEKSMATRFGVAHQISGLVLPGTLAGSLKEEIVPFNTFLNAVESQVCTLAGPYASMLII
jgi:hypothetical protein